MLFFSNRWSRKIVEGHIILNWDYTPVLGIKEYFQSSWPPEEPLKIDVKLTPPKLTLLFTFLLLENRFRLKSSRLFFSQNRFFKSRSVSHAWIARASHATCAKCGYLTTGMYGLFCSLHRIELFNCGKNQRPERWFYWKVPEKGCRLSRRHSRKKYIYKYYQQRKHVVHRGNG